MSKTTTTISLPTIDLFDQKYTLTKNLIDKNSGWDGCMFETYGEELIHVQRIQAQSPWRVWTWVNTDSGSSLCAGFHFCNRIGFIITNENWSTDSEFYVVDNEEEKEQEAQNLVLMNLSNLII